MGVGTLTTCEAHLNGRIQLSLRNFGSTLNGLEVRPHAVQEEIEMTETKIELIESSCACSADGGQCCSADEAKSEVKAEGSCCSDSGSGCC